MSEHRTAAPRHDTPRLVKVADRDAWHIYDARRRISTGTASLAAAKRFLADYIADLATGPRSAAITVADLLPLHLADREDVGRPGAERLKWSHKQVTRILGSALAEDIADTDCRAYTRQRVAEGVTPATARTELVGLRAALRWGADPRRKIITEAPSIEMPARAEPRDRYLTPAEAEALSAAADRPHIKIFIMLALHTAARHRAILGLTWDRVDLARRLLDYREPGAVRSSKRRVPVPINDALLPALVEAKARASDPNGGPVIEWAGGAVASVKHGFRDAAARAGLAKVTPHTLRHTALTWMAQRGVSMWDMAGVAGHSDPRTTSKNYAHHNPEYLRSAVDALTKIVS